MKPKTLLEKILTIIACEIGIVLFLLVLSLLIRP